MKRCPECTMEFKKDSEVEIHSRTHVKDCPEDYQELNLTKFLVELGEIWPKDHIDVKLEYRQLGEFRVEVKAWEHGESDTLQDVKLWCMMEFGRKWEDEFGFTVQSERVKLSAEEVGGEMHKKRQTSRVVFNFYTLPNKIE